MSVQFIQVEYATPRYRELLRLREDVLRKPLGLTLTDEDVINDSKEFHLAALKGKALTGCVILKPLTQQLLKLRQMAMQPESQGEGIGAGLLRFAEQMARTYGFKRIELHARGTAVGFYEKSGYRAEGESFLEQGIPHIKMWKDL